ncbi:MAG: hypothetical protein L0207_02150 [Chlamydiae bacterium]|nr:hypothetical protein [Chlamydiota bacterium]
MSFSDGALSLVDNMDENSFRTIDDLCRFFVLKIKNNIKKHFLFHFLFLASILLELVIFGYFFSFFTHTSILAFCLAGIFITIFSYITLHFYLQSKKNEDLYKIKEDFLKNCFALIEKKDDTSNLHCFFIYATTLLASLLSFRPILGGKWQKKFPTLALIREKYHIWLEWKDLQSIKELLFFEAIDQHIQLIKLNPTNGETHLSLGNLYIHLSKLYREQEELPWNPAQLRSEEMARNHRSALEKAISEYQINLELTPENPKIYLQLIEIYKQLKEKEKEMEICEKLIQIDAENADILFRMGSLYFQKGNLVAGLKMYQKIKEIDETKAKDLFQFYASTHRRLRDMTPAL